MVASVSTAKSHAKKYMTKVSLSKLRLAIIAHHEIPKHCPFRCSRRTILAGSTSPKHSSRVSCVADGNGKSGEYTTASDIALRNFCDYIYYDFDQHQLSVSLLDTLACRPFLPWIAVLDLSVCHWYRQFKGH